MLEDGEDERQSFPGFDVPKRSVSSVQIRMLGGCRNMPQQEHTVGDSY